MYTCPANTARAKTRKDDNMNNEIYNMKSYELELQKVILQERHWWWQRGLAIAALVAAIYELSGKGFL